MIKINAIMFVCKYNIKGLLSSLKKRRIEKKLSYGPLNKDKAFYIIRRKDENAGLYSLYISILSDIRYALKKNYIPIVDMKNYRNIYTDKQSQNEYNTWEFFFQQPQSKYTLEEVYQSENVVVSNGEIFAKRLSDKVPQLYNKKIMSEWRKLALKYMIYSEEANKFIHHSINNTIPKGERYVGVLARGTDYMRLKPKGHPIQPLPQELVNETKKVMRNYNCSYVFLATEDVSIFELFSATFGEKLRTVSNNYLNYTGGYLADSYPKSSKEKVQKGFEYMSSIELLSRADCFIGGRTSGTVGVFVLNGDYDYSHVWDLGVYE